MAQDVFSIEVIGMPLYGLLFVILGAVFLIKPGLFARGGVAASALRPDQYISMIRIIGISYILIGLLVRTDSFWGYFRFIVACTFVLSLVLQVYFSFMNKRQQRTSVAGSSSFSLLVLEGAVTNKLENLLRKQEYKIVSRKSVEDRFLALCDSLESVEEQRDIVRKAILTVKDYTILMDPEMVLFTNMEDDLRALSERLAIKVYSCLWERVSRTVVFLKIDRGGIVEKTMIVPGQKITDNVNPNRTIMKEPNCQGLIKAMSEAGLPVGEIFGPDTVQATVLTLQE